MFDGNSIYSVVGLIIQLLYLGTIIGTIGVIVLDNRDPFKTMAWVLVLIFLPFIGILLYVFFGRSTRRHRIISQKAFSNMMRRPSAEYTEGEGGEVPVQYRTLVSFFRNTNQSFLFGRNSVETYADGYSMLHSLIKILSSAKDHIHMEYYIFMDDAVGHLIRDILIDKAHQGVEVRVLYDDVGCWKVDNEFFEVMREEGIDVRSFLKVRFPLFTSKVNYRNHRKIVVVDGKVGMVGGMNLADRYVKGVEWGIWRDTQWLLRGKAVHGLQTVFLLDWYFVDRSLIDAPKYFPEASADGDCQIQIVTSMPAGLWHEIMQGILFALASARSYFYLQTPYFLPTAPVLTALQSAALAGVDVRIIIPEKGDSKLTQYATRSYVHDLLVAGVKVYLYQKGFIHSKMMVSDDLLCTVGTTNADFRSFEHNFEVNAFAYNHSLACQLRELFLEDQHESSRVMLKEWDRRPYRKRVPESIIRLLAPLL